MPKLTLEQIQKQLVRVHARWHAAEQKTSPRLGYKPGPGNRPLTGPGSREEAAALAYRQFRTMIGAGAPALYPAMVDWRNYKGSGLPAGDYLTLPRDQKTCGSCVAFGTVAALEAAVLIKAKNPKLNIDLSEADLFYCHGGVNPGPTCESGWNPDAALTSCQSTGVVDERCFPYSPGDQPCKKCADWQKRVTKVSSWKKVTATADMKNLLATRGPLITCMSVYEDFFNYSNGIYHHVSGALQGGHCICCVGFDDTRHAWICKNSWGTAWGEKGYFRIEYGECGIDASMWTLTV
jgi:C1A family cysteine protease